MLKDVEIKPESAQGTAAENYNMQADIISPEEWAEFENVYQIHCPSIFMDSAVRDVSTTYQISNIYLQWIDHDAILLLFEGPSRF